MPKNPEAISGEVLDDQVIQPRGYYAREIREGEVLRIIDIEGQQVADFICFNLNRLEERISPENTINLNGQVYPKVGYTLFSDEASKLMTIVEDTCGVHDMLAGVSLRHSRYAQLQRQPGRCCQALGPEVERCSL